MINSGVVDIGARAHQMAVTTFLLTTFKRSVAYHAPELTVPDHVDLPGRVALGTQTYAKVFACG